MRYCRSNRVGHSRGYRHDGREHAIAGGIAYNSLTIDTVATISLLVMVRPVARGMSYEGQHTGLMSMKSEGHMLRGEALSKDTTPLAVRAVALAEDVVVDLAIEGDVVDSGGESDGQHSGLSSLQPTRGTSMTEPSNNASPVYCGILHVPTKMAWPV